MYLIRIQRWLFSLSACLLSMSAYAAEETLDNPYGLSAVWAQGDWVAKATLLILVLMSMASWYVIFTKLMDQNRVMGFAQSANASFWNA
ncbi:MAG: MotA/TolQ/ExbB proton channel family protein, partial [Betaproteobacteria bacterium]